MGWASTQRGCNCPRRSRTRTSCLRECCGRISSGRVRSKRSGNERRAKWKRFCWKARCAIASGTRRGRRRNWGFRQRRSWRSCGERGWRSKAGKAELKPGLYKSLRANGCVESDRAEGPDDIVDRLVADGGHEGCELGWTEETGNGFGQIRIGSGFTGNEAADFRQDFAEIPAIEIPQQSIGWFREFEDGDGAARFQYALNFAQAGFVIGEVAEAKGRGDEVEGCVRERQPHGVGFEKRNGSRNGFGCARGERGTFRFCANEHSVGKIRADDAGASGTGKGKGEISRAATEIKNKRIGAAENGPETFCCARAPKAIELQREEMIQQVVTRSNPREHLAYFRGGVRFRDGTVGPSSLHRRGKFRHWGFPRDGCWLQ